LKAVLVNEIKQVVDRLTASDWLAHERRRAGGLSMPVNARLIEEEFELKLGRLPDYVPLLSSDQSLTRADVEDRWLAQYVKILLRVLGDEQQRTVSNFYFGVYPTFDVNGFTTTTPAGDRVIMLHSGLLFSIPIFTGLFVADIAYGGNVVDTHKEALLSHLSLMAWLWTKSPNRGRERFVEINLPPRAAIEHAILSNSVASFILSHELGHIFCDHKGYGSNRAANHATEYEADAWGLGLWARHAAVNIPLMTPSIGHSRLALLGPFVALGLIAALGGSESNTHPAPVSRFERVRDRFATLFKETLPADLYVRWKFELGGGFEQLTLDLGLKVYEKYEAYGRIIQLMRRALTA
jgi:hypothetical protein